MNIHSQAGFHRIGMSDSDVNAEWVLQQRLRNWVASGLRLVDEINESSELVKVDRVALEAFIHDELPVTLTQLGGFDFTAWDEKINEAAGSGAMK